MAIFKEKYYVPDITEFHVGFECEMKNSSDPKYFDWEKCIFNDDFSNNLDEDYCFEYLFGDLKNNQIRVKYLDEEDIESLGFKQESITSFVNKDNWYIEWMSGDTLDIYCVSDCRFKGIIKNKSELKRLMKQLNIVE